MKKYKIKFSKKDVTIFCFVFIIGTLMGIFFIKKIPVEVFSPDFYVKFIGLKPSSYLSWLVSFEIAHQTEVFFTLFGGFIHSVVVFVPLFLEFFELGYLISIFGISRIEFPRILIGLTSLVLASKVGYQIYLNKRKWKKVIKKNKKIILLSIILMLINDILQAS
jgi:hypothetical protein